MGLVVFFIPVKGTGCGFWGTTEPLHCDSHGTADKGRLPEQS